MLSHSIPGFIRDLGGGNTIRGGFGFCLGSRLIFLQAWWLLPMEQFSSLLPPTIAQNAIWNPVPRVSDKQDFRGGLCAAKPFSFVPTETHRTKPLCSYLWAFHRHLVCHWGERATGLYGPLVWSSSITFWWGGSQRGMDIKCSHMLWEGPLRLSSF